MVSLLSILVHFITVDTASHGRPQGGQNGHFPPWKLKLSTKIL